MNYRAIIVDDEEIIRDSFQTLISWNDLGFEICAALEDGKEAITYIQNNSIDLIITDIKMPLCSGIDVAKYVYDNSLDIHVILLSGYEDFNYARNAMAYGVKHYLLKTMSLADISEHISKVKKELDETYTEKKYMENLMLTVKKQFFLDLVFGAITKKQELLNRLFLTKLDSEIIDYPCAVLQIKIKNYDSFVNETWNFGQIGLENALENIFNDTKGFYCYILNHNTNIIKAFVSTYRPNKPASKNTFYEIFNTIRDNFKQALKIDINIETEQSYNSLYELINPKESILSPLGSNMTEKVTITQQLILSHASVGNVSEVKNLFSSLIDRSGNYDLLMIKNIIIELFISLDDKLKKFNIELNTIPDFSFNKILTFSNTHELKIWGYQVLDLLCAQINNHSSRYNKDVIEKARLYIKNHCCDDITLNDVANYVYLSPDYLSRLFKKYTNENFMDIIVKERIEKAIELLQNENYKIYEISQMVGYKTTKYFTKLFKLHIGITPKEYRNQIWRKT